MDNEDSCPYCGKEWEVVDNYHFSKYHWQEHMLCRECGYEEIQDFTVRRMFYINGKYQYVRNNAKPPKPEEGDAYAESS